MAANANNPLYNTGDPAFDAPVVLHDIKDWIEQQQLNPTPLTALQVRALADLRRSFEPDLGQTDWVSMLNLLRQSRGMPAPEYHDKPSTTTQGSWTCHCHFRPTFAGEVHVFPGPGADGAPAAPAFARKKDAKQYAARCCYEALTRQARGAMAAETQVGDAAAAAAANINVAPAATAAATKSTPSPAPASQQQQQQQQVKAAAAPPKLIMPALLALARKLGLPAPQIVIVASADPGMMAMASFFDAHVEFGGAVEVPEDVGRVTGVYGRRHARDKVAEQVYEWLVREEGKRMGEVEELLGIKREEE